MRDESSSNATKSTAALTVGFDSYQEDGDVETLRGIVDAWAESERGQEILPTWKGKASMNTLYQSVLMTRKHMEEATAPL